MISFYSGMYNLLSMIAAINYRDVREAILGNRTFPFDYATLVQDLVSCFSDDDIITCFLRKGKQGNQ